MDGSLGRPRTGSPIRFFKTSVVPASHLSESPHRLSWAGKISSSSADRRPTCGAVEVIGGSDRMWGGNGRYGARFSPEFVQGQWVAPASSYRRRYSARVVIEVSTSVASARSAPTVADSCDTCLNGSKRKNRAAFSHVILLIVASLSPASSHSPSNSSGDSGHVESECG